MKKICLVLLWAILLATGGQAQSRVAGTVELIETKPFRELQGVVYQDAAQPLANVCLEVFARASLLSGGTGNTPLATQQSAADGSFNFAGLPEGIYELRAQGPDGTWNVTRLYLKIQPLNPHAKKRLIQLPLTLKDERAEARMSKSPY